MRFALLEGFSSGVPGALWHRDVKLLIPSEIEASFALLLQKVHRILAAAVLRDALWLPDHGIFNGRLFFFSPAATLKMELGEELRSPRF